LGNALHVTVAHLPLDISLMSVKQLASSLHNQSVNQELS
jgi:hypothetical protein